MNTAMAVMVSMFSILGTVSWAAEIKGKVTSAGGEPLRQVQATVLELRESAVTDDQGNFMLAQLPPGLYTLRVAAVGYRLVTLPFAITNETDSKEVSVTMAPDNFHRTETVEVKADAAQIEGNPAIPGQMVLKSGELKQASTVLANDPFRAVQALPGVSATQNNDLLSEFSLLGAPFSEIGIYFDDVLVRNPFHALPNFTDGASVSMLSSESVEEINLMPLAYPVEFADGSGGALQLRTREGSRTKPLFTVAAGLADTEATAEGELGRGKKGSWLVTGRKSYLSYLVHHTGVDPTSDVELQDGSFRADYDLTPRNSISLSALAGKTDVTTIGETSGLNFLGGGNNQLDLVRAGWKFTDSARLLFETHGAYIHEGVDEQNVFDQPLQAESYREWVAGSRATWNWMPQQILEAGYTARRLSDGFNDVAYDDASRQPVSSQHFNLKGLRQTGYAQEVSSLFHQRLHAIAGLRWDRLEQVAANPISPQASLGFQATAHTLLQFGFAHYMQFPDFTAISRSCPSGPLPPGLPASFAFPVQMMTHADHFTAAVEQALGENTTVRLQAFDREENPEVGARFFNGANCSAIKANADFRAALAGVFPSVRARGGQIVVRRRSANKLSGWIGYTYDDASQRAKLNPFAPIQGATASGDQRHTINAFGNYRLSPSVNLSAKYAYGSGFPFPSSLSDTINGVLVTTAINTTRLPDYQRLDIRVDKSWAFSNWKMTLHVEGLNMTNHDNPRLIDSVFDPVRNTFTPVFGKGLPIVPTAGVVFEF